MKTYIRFKQHKNLTPKHETNRTTTEVSSWNDQHYKITGGLKDILSDILVFNLGNVPGFHLIRAKVGGVFKL